MEKIFGYFDKAFCINLKERVDRKLNVELQFKKIGINQIKFIDGVKIEESGIFKYKGTHGCALAHRKIFDIANKLNIENFIIFEDDIIFTDNFLQRIEPIIESLKLVNWDIFYFYKPRKGTCPYSTILNKNQGKILETYNSG